MSHGAIDADQRATPATSVDGVIRSLAARGEAPAIVTLRGDAIDIQSFAQLAAAAEAWRRALAGRGLAAGGIVGLLGPGGAAWIACFLAVIASGGIAMPLDEHLADDDLAAQIAASGCRLVVAARAQLDRPALRGEPAPTTVVLEPAEPSAGAGPAETAAHGEPPPPRPDAVALLLHTSGTTGTPKAVPLTHANLDANLGALLAERLVGNGDRVLLPLPLFHGYPIMIGVLVPLAAGAAIVFPAGLSGPELVRALRGGGVTHLVGVPRLYEALMQAIQARLRGSRRLRVRGVAILLAVSSALRRHLGLRVGRRLFGALHRALAPRLRLLVCGGAAIDRALEERLEDLGWDVLTGYGLTETSPVLTFNSRAARRAGSAGRAIAGVALRIAEPDERGVGPIEASGASVFAGYRGNDEATRRAFTADGWFRTGDLGRIDRDGFLHIAARVSETLVLADGRKLFPEPIEARYQTEPVIGEIALLVEAGRLVALVVPELSALRETGAIRAEVLIREALTRVAATLPPEARPSGFAITRAGLPRTHLGKLRRHLLPPLLARARLGPEPAAAAPLSAADRALLEDPLAGALWAWLATRFRGRSLTLDTSPQLELGIDSLGWVSLSLEIQDAVGVRLTEEALAGVTTLRELLRAALAAPRERRDDRPPPVVAPRPGVARWLGALRLPLFALNRIAMRAGFGLRVEGLEHLPPEGAFVICPNHASYLDPLAVAGALPWRILRRVHWAGWTGILFRNAAMRLFSALAQVIPIDPDRAVATSLALGGEVLARGETLVWFPEGGRSPDGELQEFLPGIAMLLAVHDVPVVPARIVGSFAAWPRQRRWPRLAPMRVTFGRPLRREELLRQGTGGSDAERVARGLRAAVDGLRGN